tara:strand:+ start:23 stop:586 length:564 start_codon:yes stop_codon:yes gene_type:complete
MTNYNNGQIYKIQRKGGSKDNYIGSTTKKYLSERMAGHRYAYEKKTQTCSSGILFDKYGIDNCEIVLIEKYPCNSKDELTRQEKLHIDASPQCVNIKGANGKLKKTIDNRKKYNREWTQKKRENNREEAREACRKYRATIKDITISCLCGKEVPKINIARHKKSQHHIKDHEEFIRGCDEALKKYHS